MQGKFTVVGGSAFNDTIDGRLYNHTKLNVLVPYPSTNKNAFGQDTISATYGTHENFVKFQGRQTPFIIDAEYEVTTKGIEFITVKFDPIQQPQPSK